MSWFHQADQPDRPRLIDFSMIFDDAEPYYTRSCIVKEQRFGGFDEYSQTFKSAPHAVACKDPHYGGNSGFFNHVNDLG